MNRRNLILSLSLFNAAVLIGAATFLPRRSGFTYTWSNQFERVLKRLLHTFPLTEFIAVALISLCISASIYFFVHALPVGDNSPEQIDQ